MLILKAKLFKLLLQDILNDLFPGIVIPEQECGVLQEAIVTVMQQNVLQPEPSMITKVIQLHDTVLVRHGVMLVGPTGGGKTTVLRVELLVLMEIYRPPRMLYNFGDCHRGHWCLLQTLQTSLPCRT